MRSSISVGHVVLGATTALTAPGNVGTMLSCTFGRSRGASHFRCFVFNPSPARTCAGERACRITSDVRGEQRGSAANGATPTLPRHHATFQRQDQAGRIGPLAYPGDCGVAVDYPHNSTSGGIHTRITSFCYTMPVMSNTVSGRTYRSRWYRWQQVASLAARTTYGPSPYSQTHRETVVAGCSAGTWYRYRTEGFGTITVPSGTYSAAAYEQNDDEIRCNYPR